MTGVLVVATVLAVAGAAVVIAGDLTIRHGGRSRSVVEALLAPTALGLLLWWVWSTA